MVVAGRQSGDETQVAVGPEAEHFSDRAQEDEVVTAHRRHADQPPEGLPMHVGRLGLRQHRCDQIDASRQRSLLARIDAKDQGPPIPFVDEPAERRRERALRPEMGFRARIVEDNEPPLPVEGQRRSPQKMVQPHHHRLEPLIRAEAVDAIAVLLAEEEVPAPRIEREAAEHGLS